MPDSSPLEQLAEVDHAQLYDTLVAELTDFAVFLIDADGNLASWNLGVERMLGYPELEWKGRPAEMIFTPEDRNRQQLKEEMKTAARDGRFPDVRWRLRKDGKRIYVESTLVALRNEDGELLGFSKVMRDVTERQQREERNSFLVRLDDALRSSASPIEIAHTSAALLGEYLHADRAVYGFFDDDGNAFHVTGAYTGPGGNAHTTDDSALPLDPAVALALRSNVPHVLNDSIALSGAHAYVTVPLHKGGRLVAAISAFQQSPRLWKAEEIELLQITSDRCWEAVERAHVSRALKESEARLTFALDAGGGVGTWDWDVRGDAVYCDARFAELYSIDPKKAAQGTPIAAFVSSMHPDDRPRVDQQIRHAVQTGEDFTAEYRLIQRDGSVRWVYARGRCYHDDDGRATHFPGLVFDITDRKHLETELAEREQRYRALFTSIDEGYCLCEMIWDEAGRPADYRFLELNPRFTMATGLTRELALNGGTARQIVPGLEDHWVERYGKVVLSGEPERFESHSPVMGRWFDVYAVAVGGSRFALVFSDVTARKTAEVERERLIQQIDAERKRLAQAFAQAPVAIAVFRGREFVVELANPLYEALLQGRDLVGRRFADVMPELGQHVWDAFHRVLDTGEPFAANEWHMPYDQNRDGASEDHWFNVAYHPWRESDESISGLIAVLTDVTAQVLARQELEKVNRSLEEFAYVASHDLQEPLRMVNIYSQLILRNPLAEKTKLDEYAGFVRQGVSRMEALLRDLLTFSRTVHQDDTPVGSADLGVALSEALSVMQTRVEETGATVTTPLMPIVHGDTQQLAHVFQNLISNALKYRRDHVAPKIQIAVDLNGDRCVVSVHDNGIGFEQKYAKKIFGLFHRLHKDEYSGTGLGLAICNRIIERYGGQMWAEGQLGEGATFFFSLPQVKNSAADSN